MGPEWFWSLAEYMAERAQEEKRMADYRAGVIASQVTALSTAYGGTYRDPSYFFASLDAPEQSPEQMLATMQGIAAATNARSAEA